MQVLDHKVNSIIERITLTCIELCMSEIRSMGRRNGFVLENESQTIQKSMREWKGKLLYTRERCTWHDGMRSAHASYITEKPINVCNLAACLCLTVIKPFSPPPPPPSGPSNLMSYGIFFRPRISTKLPVAYFLGLGILRSSWNKNSIRNEVKKSSTVFWKENYSIPVKHFNLESK
jgi:hypothetical protein